jgi:hypothetical protein
MMPQFGNRICHSVVLLLLGASGLVSGCSTARPSATDYLKSLQQGAMRGEFARSAKVDVAMDCPACNPDEANFAQHVAGAEQGFSAGCKGLPAAEASYRKIKTMMDPANSIPEYQTFVLNRMCEVAEQYQTCTAPGHRLVPIGDATAPAGALVAAIDQCRESNQEEANEILNRAIAQEGESVNRRILAGNFADAKPELRVYAALPRSSRQRAEQWRSTIAAEETAHGAAVARTAQQVRNMVCDERCILRNPETGYATVVPGMNLSHGGKIETDNPGEHASATDAKEARMAMLGSELSNAEELSATEARDLLNQAYVRASKDRSYCSK